MKPRVRFCWHCGNKLRGNHFVEVMVDELPRIVHKECAKEAVEGGDRILNMKENYKTIFIRLNNELYNPTYTDE